MLLHLGRHVCAHGRRQRELVDRVRVIALVQAGHDKRLRVEPAAEVDAPDTVDAVVERLVEGRAPAAVRGASEAKRVRTGAGGTQRERVGDAPLRASAGRRVERPVGVPAPVAAKVVAVLEALGAVAQDDVAAVGAKLGEDDRRCRRRGRGRVGPARARGRGRGRLLGRERADGRRRFVVLEAAGARRGEAAV